MIEAPAIIPSACPAWHAAIDASHPRLFSSYSNPWSFAIASSISTSIPTKLPSSSVYSNGLNTVSVAITHFLSDAESESEAANTGTVRLPASNHIVNK